VSAGCTGAIGDGRDPSGTGNDGNNSGNGGGNNGGGNNNGNGGGGNNQVAMPPSAQLSCPSGNSETPGKRSLRRLTVSELETTVRAAFGLDATQLKGLALPPDPASLDGFTNNVDRLTVGADYARGTLESARQVAGLVATEPLLGRLLPCAAAGGPPCAETFITTFGAKLYRRPLTAAERGRYLALYEKVLQGGDFKAFVYWATATMLQSAHVLYRSELGEPDPAAPGRFRLTQYELASALSYAFTGGPPGSDLLQAAAGNRLSSPDQIEAAARTLVHEPGQPTRIRPAFREVMLRFADQWAGLSTLANLRKDDMAFPDFTGEIQEALTEEARRFIGGVIVEERGTAAGLFTAPYTFVDSRLAKFYGFGAATGADYTRVDRPAGWGVGLLSQGALLAVEAHSLSTSPTKRGYFVRTRVLCGVVPPPPAVVGELPEPTGGETTRQRYEQLHVADPSCKTCHKMIDSIGFAFEHLDATGRFRAKEGQFDIDDSGVIAGTSAGDIPFRGPTELATAVSKLPETAECLASYLAAYAFGVSQSNASCLVRGATQDLRSGASIVDFYIRMSRSEHFRSRVQ
jgi:hypothetical protein